MRVPQSSWIAYPLRVIRLDLEISSGPSRDVSGLRLRSIFGALFLDLFLVSMFDSNINGKRRESHTRTTIIQCYFWVKLVFLAIWIRADLHFWGRFSAVECR